MKRTNDYAREELKDEFAIFAQKLGPIVNTHPSFRRNRRCWHCPNPAGTKFKHCCLSRLTANGGRPVKREKIK